MQKMKVRVTLLEECLGTASSNAELHREFIASKAPDAETREEEVARLGADEVADKGMTVFPRTEDGVPFLYDYQIRGFFKDTASALKRCTGFKTAKLAAHKKVIDGCIFVDERIIPFDMHGGEVGNCQRPLRAQTAQGERVALAESETVPAGSTLEFTVTCLNDAHMAYVREWLDYGMYRGLGQWRNSGKGRMVWEELDDGGNVIGGNAKA